MSLENSMRDTLIEEPDMFWFYNNGITIVTDLKDIGLGNPNQIILSDGWKNRKLPFSVINGAQTISTASRIWGSDSVSADKVSESKKKAMVLVRVITAQKIAARRKITIALNRQKPIKTEDIAFQSAFVCSFNEYMNSRARSNKKYLLIIKRGEAAYDTNAIELPLLAQLIYTCFMCPTEARNNGPTKLYYVDSKSDGEKLNSDYFREEFTEAKSEREQEEVFAKYYKALSWAFRVFQKYSSELKKYADKNSKTILGNNRWTFISLALMCMQGFSGEARDVDYSSFEENAEFFLNIRKYMNDFVKIVDDTYEGKYTPEDSKNKDFWTKIKTAKNLYSFSELHIRENADKDKKSIKRDEFVEKLIALGFEEKPETDEYILQTDSTIISDVSVSLSINDSFLIGATLYDVYYDSDTETDEDDVKYAQLVEAVCEKLEIQLGEAPTVEEYEGCPDPSVEIGYKIAEYDIDFVKNFISLMEEMYFC